MVFNTSVNLFLSFSRVSAVVFLIAVKMCYLDIYHFSDRGNCWNSVGTLSSS